jgi:hypothetical protein
VEGFENNTVQNLDYSTGISTTSSEEKMHLGRHLGMVCGKAVH